MSYINLSFLDASLVKYSMPNKMVTITRMFGMCMRVPGSSLMNIRLSKVVSYPGVEVGTLTVEDFLVMDCYGGVREIREPKVNAQGNKDLDEFELLS